MYGGSEQAKDVQWSQQGVKRRRFRIEGQKDHRFSSITPVEKWNHQQNVRYFCKLCAG